MTVTGVFGCGLQFLVGLVQQLFGALRVAVHIPLIRLLRRYDPVVSLTNKPLRCRQVWMPVADILRWRTLRDQYAARQKSEGENRAQ